MHEPRDHLRQRIRAALEDVLIETELAGLPPPSRGKVRDNYDLPDGRRLIIATDRQSAFDQVLAAAPFKGQVLTATARFWFEATADICRNHVLAFPDPNVTVARRLRMLPVEMVVRDYLAGTTATSIWPMYRDGQRDALRHSLPGWPAQEREAAGNHRHADHQGCDAVSTMSRSRRSRFANEGY